LVQPAQPRASTIAELQSWLPASFPGAVRPGRLEEIFPTPGECSLGAPGDTIVATGSIYLAGEILERFSLATPAGEGVLQDRL
jgi:dihydrofolate synthase/folylpolyglutamate synthase